MREYSAHDGAPLRETVCRMDLQYDGTGFHGWARQPGLVTVEGSLSAALVTVLGYAPTLSVAGRTDAGVHARAQVASLPLPVNLDLDKLVRSLNALTPPGLAVLRLTRAPFGFDARRDAVRRAYRYYLAPVATVSPFWERYAWRVSRPLHVESMREAASMVVGCHDFRAFTPVQNPCPNLERSVARCEWHRGGGVWWLDIEARSFLHHMVRVLVGTLVEVGLGERTPGDMQRLLDGASRREAGPTAPAKGLFLWRVAYPPGQSAKKALE